MKNVIFFLSFTAVIAGMITLEVHPNKYVENVLFLLKVWLFFLSMILWLMVGLWSSNVPSQANINAAIEFTKEEKWPWWRKAVNWIAKAQMFTVMIIALPVGQWAIFTWTVLMLGAARKLKPTAQKYLSRMHIDLDKKKAVIEV